MDETIEIQCDLPGREEEKVVYYRKGWRFKHLRIWQDALVRSSITMSELTDLISSRIISWELTDEEGEPVEFEPGPAAFDELPQEVASWLVVTFKEAYQTAGLPLPNASSPPSKPEKKTAK